MQRGQLSDVSRSSNWPLHDGHANNDSNLSVMPEFLESRFVGPAVEIMSDYPLKLLGTIGKKRRRTTEELATEPDGTP